MAPSGAWTILGTYAYFRMLRLAPIDTILGLLSAPFDFLWLHTCQRLILAIYAKIW